MSDSGSDRSRRRHRRRRTPYVAFYGPVGGNGYPTAAAPRFESSSYQDYDDPQVDFLRHHSRVQIAERDASPPSGRCSWIVEAMERLSTDIKSCGFAPRKSSKSDTKSRPAEEPGPERDKAVMEDMNAKLTKLEDAMESVQDMLQSCLERVKRGHEQEIPGAGGGRRELRNPVWRQRRFRSPDRYLYGG